MNAPRLLWTPDEQLKRTSNIERYRKWLATERGGSFASYEELWQWSVNEPLAFWESLFRYFKILHSGTCKSIIQGVMPDVKWFNGISLNYAEHIFEKRNASRPAIIFKSETSELKQISWSELENETASLQKFFEQTGIAAGDRIAGYLPCIPEATVSMLATAATGAIWSSASPDFGTNAVIDRFAPIEPKVLIAVDAYTYGGKRFDKTEVIEALVKALPTLKAVVVISESNQNKNRWTAWSSVVSLKSNAALIFRRVPFDHPLWILFSSGTTGLPKAITHSHGGILLEQLKYGAFHNDFREGQRCFWYTTTGWMMWNYIHGALLAGATMVLYDGSPGYPDLNVLWDLAAHASIHHFGTSAAFILANMKAGISPKQKNNLQDLVSIGSTGSTLPPEGFDWVYREVKESVWLASMSGGTDVCSAFVGGNPTWPVYAGEIQCRALGCRLEAFNDDGEPVTGEVGEMVITQPMPSMPIFFWNDANKEKYRESYFEMYPGIWRHGDWIEITPRQGVVIYGRSDATLNRGGIRIGTSEIYRAVDKIKEVKDSLVVCIEKDGGEFWMPLFVVMQEGQVLTDDLKKKINSTIRGEYTPRHVPDEIIPVQDVPYTISGKKTETPVKKILMGKDPSKVINSGSLKNPASLDYFIQLAKSTKR